MESMFPKSLVYAISIQCLVKVYLGPNRIIILSRLDITKLDLGIYAENPTISVIMFGDFVAKTAVIE